MASDVERELREAVERILRSESRRKLVVAGPGTGKTTLFRKLLESTAGDQESRIVLTFINNLKADLERSLSDLARVFTLHGYCQSLLHRHTALRGALSSDFICLPELATLIKKDWEYLNGTEAPHFVGLMRNLEGDVENAFYLGRGDYYNAVDFDDSVYRTYKGLDAGVTEIPAYELVLIDEYQDFNRLEAACIELLARDNRIVVAGDDDQALYSQLRGASREHIRALHTGGLYEVFPLPFCMRCPEVIVGAVNDVVSKARQVNRLEGRIEKPYRHFEPVKGADSQRYPKVDQVIVTVQRKDANYFGRYIEEAIRRIPGEEIRQANEKGDPVVLGIGGNPYRSQVEEHLIKVGLAIPREASRPERLDRIVGLRILRRDPRSNLGWRVVLESEKPKFAALSIRKAAVENVPIENVLEEEFRKEVLQEAKSLKDDEEEQEVEESNEDAGLTVKFTSFEGAKGLSAQHVFIVGLHAGDLPRDQRNIQDLEVCKFLVGLTRAKKKCSLILAKNFANQWKQPSPFLSWIRKERYEVIEVNAAYWKRASGKE